MSSKRTMDSISGIAASVRFQQWLYAHVWECGIVVLAAAVGVSRIPLHTHVPFNWDAVQYVLGLERFDLAAHQPQPPGNPLYILIGRGVNLIVHDPNLALVIVSIVASALAVWGTAVLGERLAGRFVGLAAALLVAVNPLMWLYGEVALSYTAEVAAGTWAALAAWHAYTHPSARNGFLLAVATAFAGGLRPTVLPLLGLVWLFGIARLSWRDRAFVAGATAVGSLAWLVPLLALSGGLGPYITVSRNLATMASGRTSLFDAPLGDWLTNIATLAFGLVVGLNVTGLMGLAALTRRRPTLRKIRARTVLLWAWVLPALATFSFVHFGQLGYLLLITPPLILLSLIQLQAAWPQHVQGVRGFVGLAPLLALTLALSSLWVPLAPRHDAAWNQLRASLTSFPPSETIVLSSVDQTGYFRLLGYSMPAYHVVAISRDFQGTFGALYEASDGRSTYHLDPNLRACSTTRVDGAKYIVVTGNSLADWLSDPTGWSSETLTDGTKVLSRGVPHGPIFVRVAPQSLQIDIGSTVDQDGPVCTVGPRAPLVFAR